MKDYKGYKLATSYDAGIYYCHIIRKGVEVAKAEALHNDLAILRAREKIDLMLLGSEED